MQMNVGTLLCLLRGPGEIALLDVRENGVFTQGHAFPAVSAPLSQLEFIIDGLVPRRSTPIILMDDDDGLARIAADRLQSWGYGDISILVGGMAAWQAEGLEVFSGQYVPSKAFGEFVGEECKTPTLQAIELKRWMDEGRDFLLIDCRPYSEFNTFALPGSVNCPGAELPHRAFGLTADRDRPIVVSCAGRTRGIVATQALVNAGIPNPVYVLNDGTAAWHLMGEALERGRTAVVPPPISQSVGMSIDASLRVAKRFDVRQIDANDLAAFIADGDRTIYAFDVRTPEEYLAGHLPGSRSAPGGQLVQSVDHYVGVRNARIVLIDDDGVRARFTASWLKQMGWTDVYVLDSRAFLLAPFHERGLEPRHVMEAKLPAAVREISVIDAQSLLNNGKAMVLDFQDSLGFRRSHIAGAWFAVRSRLDKAKSRLDECADVICTSGDGRFAAAAAIDVAGVCPARVHVLLGGNAAWHAAGLPLEQGSSNALSAFDDVWYNPYDFDDLAQSLTSYLRWEIDLIDQIKREEFARFSCAAVRASTKTTRVPETQPTRQIGA